MEYTIDQEVLDRAEQYIDEPEVFDDVIEKPAVVSKSSTVVSSVKEKKARSGTKQSLANEYYKKYDGDREAVLLYLTTELGMSKAGATTYFYNAKKNAKAGV